MDLQQKILTYHGKLVNDPHHRYRSWEHCYDFFRRLTPERFVQQRDHAALQLGFYLASWGMYRNSFLLQHAYSVHLGVVDCLAALSFGPLWKSDIGSNVKDASRAPNILAAVVGVREAYAPFAVRIVRETIVVDRSAIQRSDRGAISDNVTVNARTVLREATDTLVTKVLLGTVACLPACDRYFINGFKLAGFKYSRLNRRFVDRVLQFCFDNSDDLRTVQSRIKASSGVRYPFMKLVDMYFWQIGYEASLKV